MQNIGSSKIKCMSLTRKKIYSISYTKIKNLFSHAKPMTLLLFSNKIVVIKFSCPARRPGVFLEILPLAYQ